VPESGSCPKFSILFSFPFLFREVGKVEGSNLFTLEARILFGKGTVLVGVVSVSEYEDEKEVLLTLVLILILRLTFVFAFV